MRHRNKLVFPPHATLLDCPTGIEKEGHASSRIVSGKTGPQLGPQRMLKLDPRAPGRRNTKKINDLGDGFEPADSYVRILYRVVQRQIAIVHILL